MMMFTVRAFLEGGSDGNLSRAAYLHYGATLQILQARLDEFDKSDTTSAISDGTIMTVFFLASSAEMMNDLATVSNHIEGLEKIVSLRGGVRSLTSNNNIQVKVCRYVLSHFIQSLSKFQFGLCLFNYKGGSIVCIALWESPTAFQRGDFMGVLHRQSRSNSV